MVVLVLMMFFIRLKLKEIQAFNSNEHRTVVIETVPFHFILVLEITEKSQSITCNFLSSHFNLREYMLHDLPVFSWQRTMSEPRSQGS